MKTKEELITLKNEVEALNAKLAELTDKELAQVTGGTETVVYSPDEPGVTGIGGTGDGSQEEHDICRDYQATVTSDGMFGGPCNHFGWQLDYCNTCKNRPK